MSEGKARLTTRQVNQIVELREKKDLSINQLGAMFGRHPSTIFRVLERSSEEYKALQRFKNGEIDLLDNVRHKNLQLRTALYDALLGDDFSSLRKLPADKKVQLIHPLTVDSGIDTEKSLLLQGKATQITENRSLVVQASKKLEEIDELIKSAQIIDSEPISDDSSVDKSVSD